MDDKAPIGGTTPRAPYDWLRRFVDDDSAGLDFTRLDRAWNDVVARGELLDADLVQTISDAFAQPVLDVDAFSVDRSVAALLNRTTIERLWALPFLASADSVSVVTPNVGDPDLVPELRFMLGRRVELFVTSPDLFQELVRAVVADNVEEVAASWIEADREDSSGPMYTLSAGDARTGGRILDRLIAQGADIGASDVHVQASGSRGLVRYRVDGVLRLGPELTTDEVRAVVARAKAVGGMDPSIRLKPQDGRAKIVLQDHDFDLRISTLPAGQSESLVVRILAQVEDLSLASSGLDDFAVERLTRGFLDQTAGIFTVTGPTGSGKTTLLYTLLRELNVPERDIHTVEDPIELYSPGLVQVQVNPRAGMTFAGALRSILRQDPEVILVGETRDEETAHMVMQAALTGHLVATTLHTIDAPTAILRYRDLGVDIGELAEALTGASAQRLIRTLCPHCKTEVQAATTSGERWFERVTGELPPFRTEGCSRCEFTGYRGRTAIAEVLLVDPDMRVAIHAGAPLAEIRERARAEGMRSMGDVGVQRVRGGETDVDELRRVLGSDLLPREQTRATPRPESRTEIVAESPAPVVDAAARLASAEAGVVTLFIDLAPDTGPPLEALQAAGLLAYRVTDLPHGATWAEIHRPEVIVLDASDDPELALERVAEARDRLIHLDFAPIVIIPPEASGVARLLVENGFEDFVAAPVGDSELSYVVQRVLRRREVARESAARA
jgi:type II secretory ATPase GspE/PulE/Tfp pilus assembly ATPase PilB-like protein